MHPRIALIASKLFDGNADGFSFDGRGIALALQVAAASGGTSVTVSFCQADPPIWVGSQSETGPWITATTSATTANRATPAEKAKMAAPA